MADKAAAPKKSDLKARTARVKKLQDKKDEKPPAGAQTGASGNAPKDKLPSNLKRILAEKK